MIPKKKKKIPRSSAANVHRDFQFMEDDDDNVGLAPMDDQSNITDMKLETHNQFPAHYPNEWKKVDAKRIRIHHRSTQEVKARKYLDVYYVRMWVTEVLPKDKTTDRIVWERMILKDPTGENAVPYLDMQCWKPVTTGGRTLYEPRKFLTSLQNFQEEMYLYMRASIKRFICETCGTLFDSWVLKEENRLGLTKKNRLDKDIRIKWPKIVKFLLAQCENTRGSYRYLTLHTMAREDDQAFLAWLDAVKKVHDDAVKYGGGWERVTPRESIQVARDWLTDGEVRQCMLHLVKLGKAQSYPTIETVIDDMDINGFIGTFGSIPADTMPKKFVKLKQKRALAKMLVRWSEHAEVLREVQDLRNRNRQLEAQVKESKNSADHQRKKNKILEREKRKRRDEGADAETGEEKKEKKEKRKAPVPVGPFGRAKKGFCQECKNVGLGNQHHRGNVCDKKKRDAMVERAIKEGTLKRVVDLDAQRRYPLSSYKAGDCEHCKREDVPPQYCEHPGSSCNRRPGGPLDKEGVKGKKNRNRRNLEMIRAGMKKKEAREKTAANRKSVKFEDTGTCHVSAAVDHQGLTKRDRAALDKKHGQDKLWRASTKYVHGYKLSQYAYDFPLTDAELNELMTPENRWDIREVECMRSTYEKRSAQLKLRGFRKRMEGQDAKAVRATTRLVPTIKGVPVTGRTNPIQITRGDASPPAKRAVAMTGPKPVVTGANAAPATKPTGVQSTKGTTRVVERFGNYVPPAPTIPSSFQREYVTSSPRHVPPRKVWAGGEMRYCVTSGYTAGLRAIPEEFHRGIQVQRINDISTYIREKYPQVDDEDDVFRLAKDMALKDTHEDEENEVADRLRNLESERFNDMDFLLKHLDAHQFDLKRHLRRFKGTQEVILAELTGRIRRMEWKKEKLEQGIDAIPPRTFGIRTTPSRSPTPVSDNGNDEEPMNKRRKVDSTGLDSDTPHVNSDDGEGSYHLSDSGSSPKYIGTPAYDSTSSDSESNEVRASRSIGVTCPARKRNGTSTNATTTCLAENEELEWPKPNVPSEYEQRVRRRGAFYQELVTDILDLPHELWCPASRVAEPIARTYVNKAKTKADKIENSFWNPSLRSSESTGHRLLQAYIEYRDPSGQIRKGRVQLDTYSNVNYAKAGVALPRKLRPYEVRKVKGISNKAIRLGKPTAFTIMRNEKPVVIDTVKAPHGMFDNGCVALLGLDAITTLGIDVNHHVSNDRHVDVRFTTESDDLIKRAKADAIEKYPLQKRFERYLHKHTFLSERVCAEYLKKHPDDYAAKNINASDIDIAPHVQAEHRALILHLLHRYHAVFAAKTNTLPEPMKDVPPHSFKLKQGATPSYTGRPKFGPAQAKIINDWVDWAVDVGLIEPATTTSWSSRLILAAKYKGSTPKSALPDGIRVAWAGTGANEKIEKTVPTYPDAWEQLYKVANFKYKFSADGLKQYWSIPLEEKSKEVTAFWTPRGLYQFTRLVMGTKNAATVAQNAYTRALHTKLHKESLPHLANFADDFLGGANTMIGLIRHFEEFLKMCLSAGITLNPQKIRIGYEQEQFFGLTINKGRIEPAERNLDPVKNMVPPTNRRELMSVMGVFNQFSSFIEGYGLENSPASVLNSLRSPKVPFVFEKKHEEALEALRREVLSGVHLHAPDHNHKLILDTDASADGWGAVLYQMIDGEKRVIKMWSKKWKTEAWIKKPPYHREAKAWMNGLTLTIPYALYNKHPVECWTDHTPLTWIKHTSGKGPVSQFIIDMLSMIDYEMHYIKGPKNEVADALSRFPMLGPSTLQREGIAEALGILLAALTGTQVDTQKMWFYAGKDTKHLASQLYDWRDSIKQGLGNKITVAKKQYCYMDLFSEGNIRRINYTLGIWAPEADKVTIQCRSAFMKDSPFACLVPNELVSYIAIDHNKVLIKPIQQLVEQSMKITLLRPGLTWIIHGIDFTSKLPIRTVYASERVTPDFELQELERILKDSNMTPPVDEFKTRQDWIAAQKKERIRLIWKGTPGLHEAPDELVLIELKPGDPLRTIVPTTLTIGLVKWQHKNMCHVGYEKILNILKKRFYWKNMRRTCKWVVDHCALCNLLKARMRLAHRHFRAKLFCTPRTSYGADYYGVKPNKLGFANILGIIDLSNSHLVLAAVKRRTAANTAHVLFYDVIMKKGVPLLFHSDAAKEFLSVAMKSLSATLGIVQTSTLAHNPKSNAKIERVWQFVGRCLRAMTPEQYARFHMYVPIMEHVWNNVPDSDTGITPFEAEHGMRCRTVMESILQNPPREGLPASADDLKAIATSANAFMEALTNVKAVEKAQAAMRLNANGTSKIEYKLGDRVGFYLPPSEKTAAEMHKKKKHILQYTGPAEITKSLSQSGTSWKLLYKGRTYNRNVMHLTPYTSQEEVPAALQIAHDQTVWIGSYVAVIDEDTDNRYHIAQVLDITDEHTTLHYLGTKSKTLRSAKWTKLYHHPGSNEVVTEQPQNLIRNWTRFTGMIDTKPSEDSLIILPNVGLTERGRVNKVTRDMLGRLTQRHHIIGRTWNP